MLELTKAVNKTTALPGEVLTYTLTYKNTGNAAATSVAISDVVPTKTTFQSASTPGTYASGTRTVTWTIPTLAAGATANVTFSVKLDSTFTCASGSTSGSGYHRRGDNDEDDNDHRNSRNGHRSGDGCPHDSETESCTVTIPNNGAIKSTELPTPKASNTVRTTVRVVRAAPVLTLTKAVNLSTASPNGTLLYTLTYKNTGTATATAVTIVDSLPERTTYQSATGSPSVNSSQGIVTWTVPSLAVGAQGSVTVTVKLDATFPSGTTTIPNEGTIKSTEKPTPVDSNTVTTTVTGGSPVLTLAKSVNLTTAAAGSNLVYTLTYGNTGNATATNVTITDAAPSGTSLVSTTGSPSNSSGTLTWTIASLAPGATGSVTMTVKINAASSHHSEDHDDEDDNHRNRRYGHSSGDGCDHDEGPKTVTNNGTIKSTEKPTAVVSNTVTTTITAAPKPYTTYTQGGWGANPSGNNPGMLLSSKFSTVYGSGYVQIGGTRTARFTSAAAVAAFLPQGGTANVFSASIVNPTSSPAGVFAGQVLALRLSVDFSNAGVTRSGLGSLRVRSGKLAGYRVSQVIALANTVIGGTTSALPSGVSLSDLNGIVDAINNNFDNGTSNLGFLQ